MLAAILFALMSVPISFPDQATEHVDLIELNHFHDQAGKLVYDQVIFYERAPETGRFQVRAWCLVEDPERTNKRFHGLIKRITPHPEPLSPEGRGEQESYRDHGGPF